MTTPKAEALAALKELQAAVDGSAPIEGLARVHLSGTVAYTIALVEGIAELKRKRKKGSAAP